MAAPRTTPAADWDVADGLAEAEATDQPWGGWKVWEPGPDALLHSAYVRGKVGEFATWEIATKYAFCGTCTTAPGIGCKCGVHWHLSFEDLFRDRYLDAGASFDAGLVPAAQVGVGAFGIVQSGGRQMRDENPSFPGGRRSESATVAAIALAGGCYSYVDDAYAEAMAERYRVPVKVFGDIGPTLAPAAAVAAAGWMLDGEPQMRSAGVEVASRDGGPFLGLLAAAIRR